MASISEIKAKIAKKREFLKQVPTVKKEIKELEMQLKIAEAEELAKLLNDKSISVEILKKAIADGSIVLPDENS